MSDSSEGTSPNRHDGDVPAGAEGDPGGHEGKACDLAAMAEEDQKFMALAGLRTWCAATVRQVQRMEDAQKDMTTPLSTSPVDRGKLTAAQEAFQSDRHLFLLASWKVIEHIDWAKKLNFLDKECFV